VTERRTLGDLDFAYELDHPYDDDGWFGRVLIAGPGSTPDALDLRLDAPAEELALSADDLDSDDTDQWYMPPAAEESTAYEPVSTHVVQDPQRDVTPWTGVLAPRTGAAAAVAGSTAASTESWQSKPSNGGVWDFKASAAGPWYRCRRLVVASGALAVAAIVVTGILVSLRGPAVEESVSLAESTPASTPASTTTEPKPAAPAPALSGAPAAPPPALPPPPPPPPTAAEEITGPAADRPYYPPRQPAPSQSDMPEIGVTRTPVTRAPMSATPPPPRAPDRNSSTPGDAPKRGWGRW
jgi:hypothetical protein